MVCHKEESGQNAQLGEQRKQAIMPYMAELINLSNSATEQESPGSQGHWEGEAGLQSVAGAIQSCHDPEKRYFTGWDKNFSFILEENFHKPWVH